MAEHDSEIPNTQAEYRDISNKSWLNLDSKEAILWWDNPSLIPHFRELLTPVIVILAVFVYFYFVLTGDVGSALPASVPQSAKWAPALVIPISTFILGIKYLKIRKTFYVMTTKKVIYKKGIFGDKTTTSLPYDKIENFELDQGIIQNLLNYGTIDIYTGGTQSLEQRFEFVSFPEIAKELMSDAKQAYKEDLYD